MKKTITNWIELCDFIQKHKKDEKEIVIKAKKIYGDRDRKKEADENTIKNILSITIETVE